jgi:uncharacterized protein (DUF2236 family)
MRNVGALFGLAPEEMPATVGELRAYVEELSTSLRVSDEAREIASVLFEGHPLLTPLMAATRQLSVGLLHPALRSQFGLSWGPGREQALRTFAGASRVVVPRLPQGLRGPPWFVMPGRV